jgi:hypothetical protein
MNRFNTGAWSKVQCEMILAFLSFVDYFRPRFFLLENVRNFVSFNKGQTFRLTLASLIEMGYQVREQIPCQRALSAILIVLRRTKPRSCGASVEISRKSTISQHGFF